MYNKLEVMERIRADRLIKRSFPGNLANNKNSPVDEEKNSDGDKSGNSHIKNNSSIDIEEIYEVDKLLEKLKRDEPTSDNQFFRLAIMAYEIGDLNRSIVYAERFKNDEKIRAGHLANGKLALADLLAQLYLLCITMNWDFHKLRKMGAEHLAERYEDFKRDKWCEIK